MADPLNNDREPEVFERLQRLTIHDRRRRWDSTRNALTSNADEADPKVRAVLPSDLVAERFEWLESQITALARDVRRVEHRSTRVALRARVAAVLVLIMVIACIGFWLEMLPGWTPAITG